MTEHTDPAAWREKSKALRDAGRVSDWLHWYLDNPPAVVRRTLTGDRTRAQIAVVAIENAATYFEGKQVRVCHTATPDAGAQLRFLETGTILGRAFVVQGGESRPALAIRNEHGAIIAIPAANVVGIDDL